MQQQCRELKTQCVFVRRRKPGPKDEDGTRWRWVKDEKSSPPASRGDAVLELETPMPLVDDFPQRSMSGEHVLELLPPRLVGRLPLSPPLPDIETQNYLVNVFVNQLYVTHPQSIKPVLICELGTPGALPDFAYLGMLFYAAARDPVLGAALGSGKTVVLQGIYDRLAATLRAAMENLFAGASEAAIGPEFGYLSASSQRLVLRRWLQHSSLVSHVLLVVNNLLRLAMSHGHLAEDPVGDFQVILRLIHTIFEASRIRDDTVCVKLVEMVYGNGDEFESLREAFAVAFERRRRVWWAVAINDNLRAAMGDGQTTIHWRDCAAIGLPVMEDFVPGSRPLPGTQSGLQSRVPIGTLLGHQRDQDWVAPITSSRFPDGTFALHLMAPRIAQLSALVARYRSKRTQPYLDDPIRTQLTAQLHDWMAEMDPPFPHVGHFIDARKDIPSGPIGAALGFLVYVQMMFHCALTSLSSPSDATLLHPIELDVDWISSPTFVDAQENAIRATNLIRFLATGGGTIPQIGLPFFQFAVLRTGLVHWAFFRSALSAVGGGSSDQGVIAEALESLKVHASVLRKGQAAVGLGERRTLFYDLWIAATGME